MEFTFNDGFEDALTGNKRMQVMERLVRRILAKPRAPAVVLMQLLHHFPEVKAPKPQLYHPYYRTQEDLYGTVVKYYDQAWLSLRDATWRHIMSADRASCPTTTWTWSSFVTEDQVHYNNLGEQRQAIH